MSPKPWHKEGPTHGKNPPGLEDALARLHEGRPGPPRDTDRPFPSLFPMTPQREPRFDSPRGTARLCGLK